MRSGIFGEACRLCTLKLKDRADCFLFVSVRKERVSFCGSVLRMQGGPVLMFRREETMLQVNGLTITHKKDLRVILEDFNLVLNDGDKAVIIGEEGNGKSTLMKWLYDPELTEEYAETKVTRDNQAKE